MKSVIIFFVFIVSLVRFAEAQSYCNSGTTSELHRHIFAIINDERLANGTANHTTSLTLVSEASDVAWQKVSKQNLDSGNQCSGYPDYNWIKPVVCCPTGENDCPSEVMESTYKFPDPRMRIGASSSDVILTLDNVATELPTLLTSGQFNFILGVMDNTTDNPQEVEEFSRIGISTTQYGFAILAIPTNSTQNYTNCGKVELGFAYAIHNRASVAVVVLGVAAAAVFA